MESGRKIKARGVSGTKADCFGTWLMITDHNRVVSDASKLSRPPQKRTNVQMQR